MKAAVGVAVYVAEIIKDYNCELWVKLWMEKLLVVEFAAVNFEKISSACRRKVMEA